MASLFGTGVREAAGHGQDGQEEGTEELHLWRLLKNKKKERTSVYLLTMYPGEGEVIIGPISDALHELLSFKCHDIWVQDPDIRLTSVST
jgi:hypothetical protein